MQLYLKNWYDKFLEEIGKTKKLRIVSPFVNEQVIRKINTTLSFDGFELITRYKLSDFATGVSSLKGLTFCVDKGATVYGIKGLHSKIYLFDHRGYSALVDHFFSHLIIIISH